MASTLFATWSRAGVIDPTADANGSQGKKEENCTAVKQGALGGSEDNPIVMDIDTPAIAQGKQVDESSPLKGVSFAELPTVAAASCDATPAKEALAAGGKDPAGVQTPHPVTPMEVDNKAAKGEKKKKVTQLTGDQKAVLESAFKEATHPSKERKAELAKELGLGDDAGRVSRWFENRRRTAKASASGSGGAGKKTASRTNGDHEPVTPMVSLADVGDAPKADAADAEPKTPTPSQPAAKRQKKSAFTMPTTEEETAALAAKLQSDAEAVQEYMLAPRPLQYPGGAVFDGTQLSRAEVAGLVEGSALPYSRLAQSVQAALQARATAQAGEDAKVKLPAVRNIIMAAAIRQPFGPPDDGIDDVDAMEDETPHFVWQWEVRDVADLPPAAAPAAEGARAKRRALQARLAAARAAAAAIASPDALRAALEGLDDTKSLAELEEGEAKSREKAAAKKARSEEKDAEKERARLEKEAGKERARAEKEAEKERAKAEKEAAKAEKEAEKERAKAEKEAEKEKARLEKEAAEAAKNEKAKKQSNKFLGFFKPKPAPAPRAKAAEEAAAQPGAGPPAKDLLFLPASPALALRGLESVSGAMDEAMQALRSGGAVPDAAALFEDHLAGWKRKGRLMRKGGRWAKAANWAQRPAAPHDAGTSGSDDDVMIVGESEAPPAATEGPLANPPSVARYRRKYLKFHENTRPGYWGSHGAPAMACAPRHPLRQEPGLDYEVDSDDDWEEEEPGESLSDSGGEEEEEAGPNLDGYEDEEEEAGFLVPDGYLSDEEKAKDILLEDLEDGAEAELGTAGVGGEGADAAAVAERDLRSAKLREMVESVSARAQRSGRIAIFTSLSTPPAEEPAKLPPAPVGGAEGGAEAPATPAAAERVVWGDARMLQAYAPEPCPRKRGGVFQISAWEGPSASKPPKEGAGGGGSPGAVGGSGGGRPPRELDASLLPSLVKFLLGNPKLQINKCTSGFLEQHPDVASKAALKAKIASIATYVDKRWEVTPEALAEAEVASADEHRPVPTGLTPKKKRKKPTAATAPAAAPAGGGSPHAAAPGGGSPAAVSAPAAAAAAAVGGGGEGEVSSPSAPSPKKPKVTLNTFFKPAPEGAGFPALPPAPRPAAPAAAPAAAPRPKAPAPPQLPIPAPSEVNSTDHPFWGALLERLVQGNDPRAHVMVDRVFGLSTKSGDSLLCKAAEGAMPGNVVVALAKSLCNAALAPKERKSMATGLSNVLRAMEPAGGEAGEAREASTPLVAPAPVTARDACDCPGLARAALECSLSANESLAAGGAQLITALVQCPACPVELLEPEAIASLAGMIGGKGAVAAGRAALSLSVLMKREGVPAACFGEGGLQRGGNAVAGALVDCAMRPISPEDISSKWAKILRMNALECLATLAQDECARAAVFTPARALGVVRALGAVLVAAAGPELPEGDQGLSPAITTAALQLAGGLCQDAAVLGRTLLAEDDATAGEVAAAVAALARGVGRSRRGAEGWAEQAKVVVDAMDAAGAQGGGAHATAGEGAAKEA